jgi:hypothetical protein
MAEQRCGVCGCTEQRACPGGCSWVAPALCSACALDSDDVVEVADAVAAALNEECYWAAVDLGLIDGLAEDDEMPAVELDLTGGGW